MYFEREVKIKVKDLEKVRNRIRNNGGILKKRVSQIDIYYSHPCRDFKKTDEALRVRMEEENKEVTYKGPRIAKGEVKVREEVNVVVKGEIEKIFEKLGFRRIAEIEKEREEYELKGFKISLDRVRKLGEFVEIETNEPLDKLKALVEELGIPWKPVTKTYLELLISRKA